MSLIIYYQSRGIQSHQDAEDIVDQIRDAAGEYVWWCEGMWPEIAASGDAELLSGSDEDEEFDVEFDEEEDVLSTKPGEFRVFGKQKVSLESFHSIDGDEVIIDSSDDIFMTVADLRKFEKVLAEISDSFGIEWEIRAEEEELGIISDEGGDEMFWDFIREYAIQSDHIIDIEEPVDETLWAEIDERYSERNLV